MILRNREREIKSTNEIKKKQTDEKKKKRRIEVTHMGIQLELASCFFFVYVSLVSKEEKTNSVHKRKRYTSKQVKTEEENMYTNHCTISFCVFFVVS